MPDIVDLILADHARIRRLFAELDRAGREEEALPGLGAVWADLAGLLEAHAAATREICFLTLASDAVDDSGSADLDDVIEAVAEARLQPAGSRLWWRAVRAARAAETAHDDTEPVLDALRRQLTREQREVLGRQWEAFVAARASDR